MRSDKCHAKTRANKRCRRRQRWLYEPADGVFSRLCTQHRNKFVRERIGELRKVV